jgi:hypothetical protein
MHQKVSQTSQANLCIIKQKGLMQNAKELVKGAAMFEKSFDVVLYQKDLKYANKVLR